MPGTHLRCGTTDVRYPPTIWKYRCRVLASDMVLPMSSTKLRYGAMERSTWSSIGVQEEGEEGEEEGGERESMIEEGEGGEGGESKSGGAGEGERGERERGESGEGDREAGRAGQARKGIPSLSLSSVGTGPAESSERSWRSERTYRPKDYEKGMLWAFYGTCAGPNQLPVRFQLGRYHDAPYRPMRSLCDVPY
eukprot:12707-Rhodomonas_salina.3